MPDAIPHLWYADKAEEAAAFYVSLLPNSRIDSVTALPADSHRAFYDEYLAVMDLTAEFYLQTIEVVFKEQCLARGAWVSRGRKVDPSFIETALMTVEGELDDISGVGQTKAAHALTPNIPGARHVHWEQPRVGHYGIFNGRKWREQIMPRVRDFIRDNDAR